MVNFVIPLMKDELLTSHADQYFVKEVIPPRMLSQFLDGTRAALQEKGPYFILDHFDTFFSVVIHGNKIELEVCIRSFNRIHKALEIVVDNLEQIFDHGNDIDEEERETYLCINKMLAYLFSWFVCHINDQITQDSSESNTGKKKKTAMTSFEEEWEQSRPKALELLYRWLQVPLCKMWRPPIVENLFVTTLAQVCYKILEKTRDAKQKHIRQTIFEILGTLIKKYNHGITCVVRIIQLVKLYDSMAIPIATGVVHMTMNCGCNGLIKEVMNEIGQNGVGEADNRNISMFLEHIATSQPNLIIPILDEITDYLSNDFYSMRNCVIVVLGAVVQKALTSEDLTDEQKEKRDDCLNSLEEHILDCHAYVRSKVLQTWQRLCCEGAVPLARYESLLAATALRLEDKSANVRRQALHLLRTLLQSNPFAGKLDCIELSVSLAKEQAKLQELKAQVASTSKRGHAQRFELWTTLLPDIRAAIEKVLKDDQVKHVNDNADIVQDENIDPDHVFEHVRQLLLSRKVTEAVTYLWRICMKLEKAPNMENLPIEAKEECLFAFLLKIFIESEDNKSTGNEENANDAKKSEKDETIKQEIVNRKRIVNYLKNCLVFATELQKAIPIAKKLLFSTCAGDAVESCTFLGTAFQFGVAGADSCVRNALFQVFHRDQSVRNNITVVYKEIYLDTDENDKRSERQIAVARANRLIDLLKELQPGQSPAFAQLVATWYEGGELDNELLQVLWEKFSMKYPGTSPIDSRAALMMITMVAQAETNIAIDNLDVLVKIGLGARAKEDLLLARDTCRMLLKIKQASKDIDKAVLRYSNDHDMFREILTLLTDNFTSTNEKAYISFATDAINAIYHLANQPNELIKKLLLDISKKGQITEEETAQKIEVSYTVLSQLLYIIGHVAIREMVYLDTFVYKELKRRNAVREMQGKGKKKTKAKGSMVTPSPFNKSNRSVLSSRSRDVNQSVAQDDNISTGSEALAGALDDAEAEFVHNALENEILIGDGLLARFVPLVLEVCKYPEKYNNENLQAAGSLALSKMMTVSSEFCEQTLQLLVTILERSPYSGIRSNMLIGLSDLAMRFPNQVEPWSKHIYGRLRDTDMSVRRTCVRMLSNLIMREMIRVKGQVSELALCIMDEDEQIRQETKEFFNQLALKGNALYNVVPDILSRLADPKLNLEEKQFQETIRYILGLLQKEKHVDTIIEKVCARFKLAITERQWRDLSYCLSLLQFSGKSIRRLIENLPLLKDKIHYKPVLTALQSIVEQAKKRTDAKAVGIELEEKVQELLEGDTNSEMTDERLMPPPPNTPKIRKSIRQTKRKSTSDDEDSSDGEEDAADSAAAANSKTSKETPTSRRKTPRTKSPAKDDEDNDDDVFSDTPVTRDKRMRLRKTSTSVSDSNGVTPRPKRNKTNKTPRKPSVRTSTRLSKERK
ncbi:PREDICTED: condensin complex subunit 1 [Dinoponera quadriceps]|uniref:Condensin complex subunit 1 n=1 Tax=Dinoponera quadriceps TaxID=609295 RepID=A0A6P3X4L7_DINQU|nr:PREDICTED: condensin complex subunit 1 [Dinoponera quadriceps]